MASQSEVRISQLKQSVEEDQARLRRLIELRKNIGRDITDSLDLEFQKGKRWGLSAAVIGALMIGPPAGRTYFLSVKEKSSRRGFLIGMASLMAASSGGVVGFVGYGVGSYAGAHTYISARIEELSRLHPEKSDQIKEYVGIIYPPITF